MLPNFELNFETTNPYQDEAWIECLCCYRSFKPPIIFKDQIEVEILSDLFSTFSKYMKWDSPKERQFDFRDEQFPFCSSCSKNLVRVFKLDEQIQTVISDVTSTIIDCEKQIPRKKGDGVKGKADFYRRQTIVKYRPLVLPKAVEYAQPAVSEKAPCGASPEQYHTSEDNGVAPAVPFKNSGSGRRSIAKKIGRFEDRVQRLGDSKFIYDNKYLFSRSLNYWQCLGCDESYFTKFDILLHWETAQCFNSQHSIEIIETLPRHDETVPEISSGQESSVSQRDQMSNKKRKNQRKLQKEGEHPFACTKCSGYFKSKYGLQNHILRLHTDESCKTFVCQICTRKFATESLLKCHLHCHKKAACPICGKFYHLQNMSAHKKLHKSINSITAANENPPPQKEYKCKFCHSTFPTKPGLTAHLKCCRTPGNSSTSSKSARNINSARIGHQCQICSNIFSYGTSLKTHILSYHTPDKDKAFQCRVCGKKYALKSLLKIHFRTHEKVECDICNNIYAVNSIYYHKYLVHNSVECTICYKNFQVDSIKEHAKLHKEQDPKGRAPASRHPRGPGFAVRRLREYTYYSGSKI